MKSFGRINTSVLKYYIIEDTVDYIICCFQASHHDADIFFQYRLISTCHPNIKFTRETNELSFLDASKQTINVRITSIFCKRTCTGPLTKTYKSFQFYSILVDKLGLIKTRLIERAYKFVLV